MDDVRGEFLGPPHGTTPASMDRILISLKKENGPRASSAPALGLNTIIFKHVYCYMQQTQVSVYRTIGPLVKIVYLRRDIIAL